MEQAAIFIVPPLLSVIAYLIISKIGDTDKTIEKHSKKIDYQSQRITDHIDDIRSDFHEVKNKMIDIQRDQNAAMAKIKSEQTDLKKKSVDHERLFNLVFKVADRHEKIMKYYKKKD